MAERLASQGLKVLIIDKNHHIGGNCYDYKDENNILIHKYGPHLFHTNNQEVWKYLSQFTEWQIYHHNVLALIDGEKVPIPFNLNTLHDVFPASLANKLELKLLENYPYYAKIPILELKKATDTDLNFLADYVYEKIFINYSSKQWGMKPEDMDNAVTARVPILIGRDNGYFNDSYQAVPKCGYTQLFEKMLRHPNISVMLGTSFNEVGALTPEGFSLFGQKFEGQVIYTGQLDELFDYRFGELPYRSTDMSFESIDTERYQEAATVNYPNNYDFTRITEFKHIHPIKSDRTTILKEYPQKYVKGENNPLYPVFTDDSKKLYDQYFEFAQKYDRLILLGRLAEYKYYDMDDMVERALNCFIKEINNGK